MKEGFALEGAQGVFKSINHGLLGHSVLLAALPEVDTVLLVERLLHKLSELE
jgi:hypothetical protein